jgi:hypothetical protein
VSGVKFRPGSPVPDASPANRNKLLNGRLRRDDVWSALWKLRDDRRIEVQRFGDHIDWTVRQPIGQRHLLKPIRSKDFNVHEIRVAGVFDIVAKRFFDIADVARRR